MQQHLTHTKPKMRQAGFTIIELMIATLIFSTILLVITAGVLDFSKDYYKGINSSTTQDVASTIMNNVAQSIQFGDSQVTSGASTDGSIGYVCTDSKEFLYFLGVKEPSTSPSTGVYEFNITGTDDCYNVFDDSTSPLYYANALSAPSLHLQDLLQPHMRLVGLSVSANGGTVSNSFNVAVSVAYGDSDLFCDTAITDATAAGACGGNTAFTESITDAAGLPYDIFNWTPPDGDTNPNPLPDIRCKAQAGSQFCDVAALSTTVQARVQ